jgi:hypothetical protein
MLRVPQHKQLLLVHLVHIAHLLSKKLLHLPQRVTRLVLALALTITLTFTLTLSLTLVFVLALVRMLELAIFKVAPRSAGS